MSELGRRLVKSLLIEKTWKPLEEKGISEDDLFDDAKHALKFVRSYNEETGLWPTQTMVEESIGRALPEDIQPLVYIVEQIRKRSIGVRAQVKLQKAAELLESREPDQAIEILEDFLSVERSKKVTKSKIVSYRDSFEERHTKYLLAKEHKGLIGIPTPWAKINYNIQGWVNGWMHVVAALANTGKTWFECICAEHAERVSQKKVLFVSLEMATDRIMRRIDALRYKIPFGSLRDCTLDALSEAEYVAKAREYKKAEGVCPVCKGEKEIEETIVLMGDKIEDSGTRDIRKPCEHCKGTGIVKEQSDIIFADKELVRTVYDVYDLIQEHGPEIVFIDGGYRFETRRGGGMGRWEDTVTIINELQIAAEKSKIPWIVSTQFGDSEETGKEKKKGKHVRAWNVRYGKEWFINPDVLIGLYQDDDLRLIQQMELHTLKMRDADKILPMCSINWNTDKMDYTQVEEGTGMEMFSGEARGSHEIAF